MRWLLAKVLMRVHRASYSAIRLTGHCPACAVNPEIGRVPLVDGKCPRWEAM